MKKFKINGISVKADSIADAIHQVKDLGFVGRYLQAVISHKNKAIELASLGMPNLDPSSFEKTKRNLEGWIKQVESDLKEIESYLKKGYSYSSKAYDSLDSINDSAASDIVREIKAKYPKVKVRQVAKEYKSNYGGNYHKTTLMFTGFPGEGATGFGNDPRTKDRDNWVKFLNYIYKKYMHEEDDLSVRENKIDIYEKTKHDSEDVEDLATVDKTFLLTLTRKIISNITSDNFTAAQTQAKELERYINNVRYADSVDDSVNDSYNWKQLIEKNKFDLTYQYETGGRKVPLKLYKQEAKYDIEEIFNIKNYTEQDVREYQRAWEEFARKYRGKSL